MQNGLITYWKQNCKTQQNQHAQESTWTCVCHTCHSSGLVPHLCRFGLATNLSGEGGVWCPSDQNQFDGWFQPSDLNLIIFARLTDSSRKPEINPLLDIFPSLRYGAEPSLLPLSHFRARSLSTPLNTPLLAVASPRNWQRRDPTAGTFIVLSLHFNLITVSSKMIYSPQFAPSLCSLLDSYLGSH